jgi:hypothetical protein
MRSCDTKKNNRRAVLNQKNAPVKTPKTKFRVHIDAIYDEWTTEERHIHREKSRITMATAITGTVSLPCKRFQFVRKPRRQRFTRIRVCECASEYARDGFTA